STPRVRARVLPRCPHGRRPPRRRAGSSNHCESASASQNNGNLNFTNPRIAFSEIDAEAEKPEPGLMVAPTSSFPESRSTLHFSSLKISNDLLIPKLDERGSPGARLSDTAPAPRSKLDWSRFVRSRLAPSVTPSSRLKSNLILVSLPALTLSAAFASTILSGDLNTFRKRLAANVTSMLAFTPPPANVSAM